MSKNVPNQFDGVTNEKEEEKKEELQANEFLDLDKYKTKKERATEKEEKSRVTIFIDPDLAKRLEKKSKEYGKGFKSEFTADALETALDLLDEKERQEREARKRK